VLALARLEGVSRSCFRALTVLPASLFDRIIVPAVILQSDALVMAKRRLI